MSLQQFRGPLDVICFLKALTKSFSPDRKNYHSTRLQPIQLVPKLFGVVRLLGALNVIYVLNAVTITKSFPPSEFIFGPKLFSTRSFPGLHIFWAFRAYLEPFRKSATLKRNAQRRHFLGAKYFWFHFSSLCPSQTWTWPAWPIWVLIVVSGLNVCPQNTLLFIGPRCPWSDLWE